MNSESAVSPETALITLPSRPQKRFSAQYSRDKQGNLSMHQCAISLSIGDHVGHRHARQVARAHERRGHVEGAPELDAQDGRLGGQKRNARARKPDPWRPACTRRNRERFANRRERARPGATDSRTGRQAENYSLKYTRARRSLRRATPPFSKSVLSLFWVILFEVPESIAFTSPTPNSAPDDSKHFKTSFSPCLIRCSSSGNQRQYLGAAR